MSGATTSGAGPKLLLDYLKLTEQFLATKGVETPKLDAEVLLAHVLGLERIELYTNFERPLASEEVDRYRELVKRRATREPVHYIVGRREFWSLDFAVDRRVLVPRPETELLVELGVKELSGRTGARIADIGTGSGALAVSLAHELPDAVVVASDFSAAALEIAPGNAERNGVGDRIEFVHGDLFEPYGGMEPFDLVVSNPPYVTTDEYEELEPEVRDWEPPTALVAEDDGMLTTLRLIEAAPPCLMADGVLMVEVGTQSAAVGEAFEQRGWRDVTVHKDLAGHDRVIRARVPISGTP